MEKQKYAIIETKKNNCILYGLQITDTNNKIYTYKYIAETKEEIEQLISQMSSEYIFPVHFTDIISDFIMQKSLEKISCLNT